MPTIEVEGQIQEVEKGENLRKVLRKHFPGFLYRPPMNLIHCRGLGTCGTCAVKIEGQTTKVTAMEKWRLNFPPHSHAEEKGLRLACQVSVIDDLKVQKLAGLWGQGSEE